MSDMDEFEKNMLSGGVGAGNFWRAEKEGDQIFGLLVRNAETRAGEVFVIKLEDGTEKMLPSHASLNNQFERNGIGLGDQVLIKFMGWSTRKYFGKNIRLYQIAAKHPDGTFVKQAPRTDEEFEQTPAEQATPAAPVATPTAPVAAPKPAPAPVVAPAPSPVPVATPAEPPPVKKTRKPKPAPAEAATPEPAKAEAPKEEAKPAPVVKEVKEEASKDEEVKHFVGQLFKFFDTMPVEDLNKYVNETRNFGLPVDVIATMCDLTIFEKDGKKLVQKKKA